MRRFLPILLLGCGKPSGTGSNGDADTDADTDSDTDSDADTDDPREPGPNAGCTSDELEDDLVTTRRTVTVYDVWGEIAEQRVDQANDGTDDTRLVNTWDEDGHLTLLEAYEAEVLDHTWSYLWDGDQLSSEVWDDGADGTVDLTWTHGYDSADNLVTSLKHTEAWGGQDDRIDYGWDGEHLASVEYDDLDNGVVDHSETYTWSGDLLTHEEADWDGDGTADNVVDHSYAGDERVQSETDQNGDGAVDFRETFTWSAGRLVKSALDENLDGEPEQTTEWQHDSAGRVTREYHSFPRAETPEWEILWTYDGAGRETAETRGWDGDLDYTSATTWDCE